MSAIHRSFRLFPAAAALALTIALAAPVAAIAMSAENGELCADCGNFLDPKPGDPPVATAYVPLIGYQADASVAVGVDTTTPTLADATATIRSAAASR